MIDYYNGQLTDIMPVNLQNVQTKAISYSVQKALQKLLEYMEACATYGALQKIPDQILNLMAVELRTQYYDQNAPRRVREQMVSKTLAWYMGGGTGSVLEEYLSTIYDGGKVEEWYDYKGEPYHFKTIVSVGEDAFVPIEECRGIIERIKAYKNVRSWLEALILKMDWYIRWIISYEAAMRIEMAFYPRYNLPFHYLEDCHELSGSGYLNGYDVGELVDFYPLIQQITGTVSIEPESSVGLNHLSNVEIKSLADAKTAFRSGAGCDIGYLKKMLIGGNVNSLTLIGQILNYFMKVKCQAASGAKIKARGSVKEEVRMQQEVNVFSTCLAGVDYSVKLKVEHNLRHLDGAGFLNGNNVLNADVLFYTL